MLEAEKTLSCSAIHLKLVNICYLTFRCVISPSIFTSSSLPYFDEPLGGVKIQTTSKNFQRYYTTKGLRRDLLSNTPNCYDRAGDIR